MPSPWDAFPPVEPVSPKQTGNPWDAFPPVDDTGFSEPAVPPSDVYDTPPDFYGPPDPGRPVVEPFGPPDLQRFQPLEPEVYRDTRTAAQMPDPYLSQQVADTEYLQQQDAPNQVAQLAMKDFQTGASRPFNALTKSYEGINPKYAEIYDRVWRDLTDRKRVSDLLNQEENIERQANLETARELGPFVSQLAATGESLGTGLASIPLRVTSALGLNRGSAAVEELSRRSGLTRQAADEVAAERGGMSQLANIAGKGVGTAAEAFLNRGPGKYGAEIAGGISSAANTYNENRSRGVDAATASANAVMNGLIEAGVASKFKQMGLGGLESVVAGEVKKGVGRFVAQTGAELAEENITSLWQGLNSALLGKLSGEELGGIKSVDDLVETIKDTTAQTVAAMGAAKVANVVGSPKQAISDFSEYIKRAPQALKEELSGHNKLSRRDVERLGITERTSAEQRDQILAELNKQGGGYVVPSEKGYEQEQRQKTAEKQILESQPELASADPEKTVGAEFNTPLAKRPAETPMPAEEFDEAVRQHSLKVRNQIDSFDLGTPPVLDDAGMAKAKEAFIQYGIDNYKSTREEREAAWENLQALKRKREAEERAKAPQKQEPPAPVQPPQPERAEINPQDFEIEKTKFIEKKRSLGIKPEAAERAWEQKQQDIPEAIQNAEKYLGDLAEDVYGSGVNSDEVRSGVAAWKRIRSAMSNPEFASDPRLVEDFEALEKAHASLSDQGLVPTKKYRFTGKRVAPSPAPKLSVSEPPATSVTRKPVAEKKGLKPLSVPQDAVVPEGDVVGGDGEKTQPRGGTIQAMAAGSGVLPIGGGKKPAKAVSKYRDIIPAIQRDILGTAPQQIGKVAVPGVNGVRGYYKRYQEVVRIGGKDAGSLHVVAHEAAHHMDKVNNAVNSAPQNIKDELAKMDYDPQAARPSEGFAEFVYDYYANDGQRNPTVKQWFEQEFLPKNPALQKSVAKIKNLVEGYIGQDVQQRVQADRSKTGEAVDTTPTQTFVRNVETKLAHLITDRLAGLEKAEFAALRQLGKSVSESKLYQMAMHFSTNKRVVGYDHFTKGAMNIETGERIGPGMEAVYETLGDVSDERINSLMDYAEAMRSLDHIKRGRATSMTKSDAQEIATRFKDDQKIKDAHRLLVEHSVGNVKMAREAGLISPEEADAIIASEPNYVPFKRVMEFDAFEQAVSKGGAPFMEFTGSSRQLKDIQAAILDNDARAANAAQKAHLIHSIAKFAEDNEGLGWLATEVEGAKEPHTYRIYRHGQYRNYRVDPAVFAALEGGMSMKNPDEFLGALSSVMRTFATVKRLGATALNASFQLVANPARDIPAGVMRTEGFAPKQALRSVLAIPRAAMDAYRQVVGKKGADDFELARSLAVQMSGTGVDFESMVYDARKLQQQMQGKGYKAAIRSPLQTATEVLGFMEMAPRVAEIAAMMDKFGYTMDDLKNGKPLPAVVRAKIGEAGRNVTLNFPRGGTATKALNLWDAFTNVMVQGPSQALRTSGFKGWDPRNWDGKAASKAFVRGSTLLTMPMIAMWLKNKDDEEYQKLDPYEKMLFWNFKIAGQWVKIPRIDGYSMVFAGIPEMALNGLTGRDDRAAKDAIKVLEDAVPSMDSFAPDIAQPLMEIKDNKDFRGRPIVGKDLEGQLPVDQYDEYTTEFAKSLGAFTGWSPKKIDYALKAYTGGGATTASKLAEQGITLDALGGGRFDPRVERSKSIDDFYEDMKTSEQAKNSADAKLQKALKAFSQDKSEANKQKVREAEKALEEKTPDYKLKSEIGSLIADIRKVSAGYDKEGKKMASRYISGLSDVALGNKITQAYPIPVGKDVPAEVRSVAVKFLATKLASISKKNNTTDKEYEEYEKMGYTRAEAKALDAKRVEEQRKFNVDLIKKMSLSQEALMDVVKEARKQRGVSADDKYVLADIKAMGL